MPSTSNQFFSKIRAALVSEQQPITFSEGKFANYSGSQADKKRFARIT